LDIITDDRRNGEAPFDFCPGGERAGSAKCDGGGGERGGQTTSDGVTFVQCEYKRRREDIPGAGGIDFRFEGDGGDLEAIVVTLDFGAAVAVGGDDGGAGSEDGGNLVVGPLGGLAF